MPNEHFLSAIA